MVESAVSLYGNIQPSLTELPVSLIVEICKIFLIKQFSYKYSCLSYWMLLLLYNIDDVLSYLTLGRNAVWQLFLHVKCDIHYTNYYR